MSQGEGFIAASQKPGHEHSSGSSRTAWCKPSRAEAGRGRSPGGHRAGGLVDLGRAPWRLLLRVQLDMSPFCEIGISDLQETTCATPGNGAHQAWVIHLATPVGAERDSTNLDNRPRTLGCSAMARLGVPRKGVPGAPSSPGRGIAGGEMSDTATVKTHAAFIWSVADLLRGDYKQSEYGKVILPLTVLRRLDCVLAPTKPQVIERLPGSRRHRERRASSALRIQRAVLQRPST